MVKDLETLRKDASGEVDILSCLFVLHGQRVRVLTRSLSLLA